MTVRARWRRVALVGIGLALAFYVVWDRVEAYRLSTAIAAGGGLTTLETGLPTPETAEQRETADLYAQAADFAYDRDIEENHRASRLDIDAPAGTEIPLDEIRAKYRGGDPALELLDRATPMDFHGFEADQRGEDIPQLSKLDTGLVDLGSFACLRADLASISGDAGVAVAALVPCISLQRALSRPSAQWMHSVRILGSLRIFFRHIQPSEGALVTLQRAIQSWPEHDTLQRSTLLDRAVYAETVKPSTMLAFVGVGAAIESVVLHPIRLSNMRRALTAYDGPVANARRPWSERWAVVEREQGEQMQAFLHHRESNWFVRTIDPFGAPFVWSTVWIRQAAFDLAARRVAALAVSLELYRRQHGGTLPASIDAPEDPFSGKPLIVKRDVDGFVIYGVDVDHRDDGGILYGFGAAQTTRIGPQSPRDFGIRVGR